MKLNTVCIHWLQVAGIALAGCAGPSRPSPAPASTPAPTASADLTPLVMTQARSAHTATRLPDGRVLITGGFADSEAGLASVELFDPATLTFTAATPMAVGRQSHTATLLDDGRVLIVGGLDRGRYLASAEIFDPATGTFSDVSRLGEARAGHVATRLSDGRVLIVGGVGEGWVFLSSAEVFDPQTGTFAPTGALQSARESHTATLLADGRVLVVGGHGGARRALIILDSAELYDPATGTFSATGSLAQARHKHDAVLLPDGQVLILGGADERDDRGQYRSTERYDPDTGQFAAAADMGQARYKFQGTSQLLPDGRVLVLGGATAVEWFDPQGNQFAPAGLDLGTSRLFAATSMLVDGRVLLTGGYSQAAGGPATEANAWLIRP